jgi:hypothetical protein
MLKGGCDFGPRAVSTRLLGGSWWVFTLVIVRQVHNIYLLAKLIKEQEQKKSLHYFYSQINIYFNLIKSNHFVFLFSAYTANLAAVLTVSRPHIPIRNIDDLANQSDISYGTINGGSTMQFFQATFCIKFR